MQLPVKKKGEIPDNKEKLALLIEKGMPQEKMLEVLAFAKEQRAAGKQVMLSIMKKNKKFQKEQLSQEGYTEIKEFFK